LIFSKNASWNGFIVSALEKKVGNYNFFEEVPKLIKNGDLKLQVDERDGLEHAAQLLVDILKGENKGKGVIKVADQ
jgi:NADPH-dependent curcumin reductase CurA